MVNILQAVAFSWIFSLKEGQEVDEEMVIDVLAKCLGIHVNNKPEENVINNLQVWPHRSWIGKQLFIIS